MESKLGALIPLTQREPQTKKKKVAPPDRKGPPTQAPLLGKGDINKEVMPRETRVTDADGQSSGRELYSQVLSRRQKTAVKKQQRKENVQAKIRTTGCVLQSTS